MRWMDLRKLFVGILFMALLTVSCTKNRDEFMLEKGSQAYELAIGLAELIPALHPDLNRVMVVSVDFKVTIGETIQSIVDNQGKQAEKLKELQPAQLKEFIEMEARRLAERRLLLAEAAEVGISVEEKEINQVFLEMAEKLGGEEKYLQFLESNGQNVNFVKRRIQKDLIINRFLRLELGSDFPVSEEEVRKVYDQDKTATVRHILLRTEGKTEEEKRQIREKMEEFLIRAKGGEDFAQLAKTYSEDPGSRDNGGLYENFGRGVMLRAFEYAAFTVPIGEISGIIETVYGYHILKVLDRKKDSRSLDEVRSTIVTQIKRAKQGQAYQDYMTRLKEKNNFQLNPL